LLGALSAAAALLAGCSSSASANRPLGDGGSPGQQCMQYPEGKPVSTGIYDLDNSGPSPVTITSITLPSSRRLRMTKAWLAPIGRQGGDYITIGAGYPYPPSFSPVARAVWAQRRPLIGAVIKPGKDLNLVFGLTRTGSSAGRSAGPKITYTSGGNTYTVSEQTSLVVAARCF